MTTQKSTARKIRALALDLIAGIALAATYYAVLIAAAEIAHW